MKNERHPFKRVKESLRTRFVIEAVFNSDPMSKYKNSPHRSHFIVARRPTNVGGYYRHRDGSWAKFIDSGEFYYSKLEAESIVERLVL